jgi:hypothetical protein
LTIAAQLNILPSVNILGTTEEASKMPGYEGIVTEMKEDGKAEVLIQPRSAGIIGASAEVNNKVCHCTPDGSSIRIDVENKVGAGVGDWVLVNREMRALMRNAAALLGIPSLGGAFGLFLALMLSTGLSLGATTWVIFAAGGLLIGIVVGVSVYKRVAPGSQASIDRVIRTRSEIASMPQGEHCTIRKSDGTCDTCAMFSC